MTKEIFIKPEPKVETKSFAKSEIKPEPKVESKTDPMADETEMKKQKLFESMRKLQEILKNKKEKDQASEKSPLI